MFRLVEFPSEGATLRGRLYLPEDAPGPFPVVVMAHGFSATINGMVADRYAEAYQEAGLAVLLYDHRNFGLSGGEPRQEINRWVQARGYRDAMSFITALPEIDSERIALWGDSLSGAEVIVVASMDARVRGVVAQVPACGEHLAPPDPDGRGYGSIRDMLLHTDLDGLPRSISGPLPVVSFDAVGTPCLLPPLTAFRWFMEYGGHYGTKWENRATVVNLDTPVRWHAGLCSPYVSAPLLMVVAQEDEMPGSNSTVARAVYDAAAEPKQLIEIDGGHFGLLEYPSALFDRVCRAQVEFLTRCLSREPVAVRSPKE